MSAAAALAGHCPRCGAAFCCGMAEATPCACTGVTLDATTLARIGERWRGCLCLDCLRALAAGAPMVNETTPTATGSLRPT